MIDPGGMVAAGKDLPDLSMRERIDRLEAKMRKLPQVVMPVKHYFADGLYLREITIPKGTLMTGITHKFESMDVVSTGAMTVINEKGETGRIVAPCTLFSPPGVKKAGFALEDTRWTSIHANPTNERDIRALEELIFDCCPADLDRWEIERHQEDYRQMLVEYGFSHKTAREQSESMDDRIALPMQDYGIMVAESPIEGQGLFAIGSITAGETIAPARVNGMRTEAGRFTNHSTVPNAIMYLRDDGNIDLVATRKISEEEITVDYRQSLRCLGLRPIKEVLACQE